MATEPVFFNPLDPAVHADPYPQYRLLREQDPVHQGPLGFWIISRYQDIAAALRDPRFGHAMDETAVMLKIMEGPGSITIDEFSRWMLFRDPPDHTRLRKLVSKAFTPRAVELLRPRIQAIVDRLVDDLVAQLADGGVADLVEGLALPLPVTVISELLGVPDEDRAQAREWAEAVAQALDPIVTEEQALRSDAAVVELTAYLKEVIAERRRSPGTDLLSELIAAEDEGGHLNESELISTVALLFGAGHETTRNLIGNGMLALMRNPAEMARLREAPAMIRPAIEELLRYDSPVQNTGRVAKEDTYIGSWPVPKGQPVAFLLGAGNRDPEVFTDPERLDVGRVDVKPLSFGGGIHFCLGAMLARMEGAEAFGALLTRVPEVELATENLEWRPHITLRGLSSLPVRAA